MEKPRGTSTSGTTRYWDLNSAIKTLSIFFSTFLPFGLHSFLLETGLSSPSTGRVDKSTCNIFYSALSQRKSSSIQIRMLVKTYWPCLGTMMIHEPVTEAEETE